MNTLAQVDNFEIVHDFEIGEYYSNSFQICSRLQSALQELLKQSETRLSFDMASALLTIELEETAKKELAYIRRYQDVGYEISELEIKMSKSGPCMLQILQNFNSIVVRMYGVHNTPWYFSQGATAIGRFIGQGFFPKPCAARSE